LSLARHAIQTLLATFTIGIILIVEDAFSGGSVSRGILIAALGSTGFVLFITPHAEVAQPRHSLGSHAIAIAAGTLFGVIGHTYSGIPIGIAAAVAVGVTMFIMALTDTSHAPAAGTALGMSVQEFHWDLIVMFLLGILALVFMHHLFKGKLKNLVQ